MRFRTISIPDALRPLRESWEARAGKLLGRGELSLWSELGVDRHRVLERLLALAAEHGWFVRVDPGWSARDVRFYGDRWCKADLLSVTENHGGGRRLTRLRVRIQPTLYHNALVLLLGYLLTLATLVNGRWALALLPFLAAAGWRLFASRRRLRSTVNASVLAVAEELGLDVLGMPAAPEKSPDAGGQPPPDPRRGTAPALAQAAAASARAGLEL
jgi:hypothetical protein